MTSKTTKKPTQHISHKPTKKLPIRHLIIIGLLGINLAFNIQASLNSNKNAITNGDVLQMEILKAWWEDNFKLMQKIFQSPTYIDQQKQNLEKTLEAFGDTVAVDTEVKEDKNDLKNMKKTFENMANKWVFEWDKKARFTIYEYSELRCPYCKRQHTQWNLKKVLDKFGKNVNTSFRHFIVHPGAQKYAEAAECVRDQNGDEGYLEFIDKAFNLDSAINDTSLDTILDEMKLNKEKVLSCIEDGTHTDLVKEFGEEWRKFWVTWTPGNLIVDNDTGRYVLVPGAYPADKFIEEIQKLMNK